MGGLGSEEGEGLMLLCSGQLCGGAGDKPNVATWEGPRDQDRSLGFVYLGR